MKILSVIKKEEPPKDGEPKKKKVRIKGKETTEQYGIYSGIVNDEGKKVDKPTDIEVLKNTAQYMKNNKSDQSDSPSTTYRLPFSHLTMNYKKKPSNNA